MVIKNAKIVNMYCIIIEGTDDFLRHASEELVSKGMSAISGSVFIANSTSGFDGIARGLKNLSSYKKSQSRNKIYKTTSLIKI